MEIYKEFVFEAAHRLPNVPEGHKCARLHGHSWKGTIYVSGDLDPALGWIMDYADIKSAFAPIYEQLDQPKAALRYVQQALDLATLRRDHELYRVKYEEINRSLVAGY